MVLNPLVAASTAVPNPVAPPPIMHTSQAAVDSSCFIKSSLFNANYLNEKSNRNDQLSFAQAILASTARCHPFTSATLCLLSITGENTLSTCHWL